MHTCAHTLSHTHSLTNPPPLISIGKHRHMPEIEQGLSEASGSDVKVSFTPHLMNLSRCRSVCAVVCAMCVLCMLLAPDEPQQVRVCACCCVCNVCTAIHSPSTLIRWMNDQLCI